MELLSDQTASTDGERRQDAELEAVQSDSSNTFDWQHSLRLLFHGFRSHANIVAPETEERRGGEEGVRQQTLSTQKISCEVSLLHKLKAP